MTDHIDFVVKQWRSTMPDLDTASMEIFGRMLRIMKHLGKVRSEALAPFGFREGEFDVLATLRRAGAPYRLSPTQLYKSLLVTSGAMTHRLNRLEEAGWIVRVAEPGDKRSMLVALTDAGREKIEQALLIHVQTQNALLARLDNDRQAQLTVLLTALLNATEA
ncbi:MarR family transcriptional regulator [Mixta gaviniae]|nr:MarR family transcriptional regulator [Mixta gaviniae]